MLAMPSANMRQQNNKTASNMNPIKGPEFNISSKDVEGLVLEIKENLRVSAANTLKALPCGRSSHFSRKSSRASPYLVPAKLCSCDSFCDANCARRLRRKPQDLQEDPYELLQRLLRDGSLVNEAVRRVQLGLSPKQRYFYDSEEESSILSMGQGTLEISLEMFLLNRNRLSNAIQTPGKKSIVVLQGGDEVPFYDTDVSYNVFRQESYFMWLFGVLEVGCIGAVDTENGNSILFVPRLPANYAVWMGPLLTLDDYKQKYQIDSVYYIDEVAKILHSLKPDVLLTLNGVNSDSGLTSKEADFKGITEFQVDNTVLFKVIANLRVVKTDMEIEVMKYVVEVSSAAHRKVMLMAKAGKTEYQCESTFLHYCYSEGGCRFVSYTCICGSGPNGAILHYGHAGTPNNRQINEGDMCLFDMGANYYGYCSDITCSFPENGKFTSDQALIYSAVYDANMAVFRACKPGVSWLDMHTLAMTTLLTCLKKGGLLVGDVQKMVQAGLGAIFQPHGLGHLIGLDVHDVGGYLENDPKRPVGRANEKLRTNRILTQGMCLTIEPGCYFIETLLEEAYSTPELRQFLVPDVINRFRGTGGVRIEDDVVITATGCINLTKVPRTIKEIENYMAGVDKDEKYH